jgi:hypothetical protein
VVQLHPRLDAALRATLAVTFSNQKQKAPGVDAPGASVKRVARQSDAALISISHSLIRRAA